VAISEKQLKDDYTEWSTKGHKFLRTSETGRAALRGKIPEEWFQSVMRQIHYNVHRDIDVDEYRVEAEHMAEVVKGMGRAVNTGFFILMLETSTRMTKGSVGFPNDSCLFGRGFN